MDPAQGLTLADPADPTRLTRLVAGAPVIFGGDRIAYVSPELARDFRAGDRLLVVQDTGALLHIPAREARIASDAVGRAQAAFQRMGSVSDAQISAFFDAFASHLSDDARWGRISAANAADVEAARSRGRSTTRLAVSEGMRGDMIAGLRAWRDAPAGRGSVAQTTFHEGWQVDQTVAPLGVVGFVFEGRPNVFADATGVLRTGNTVVFRIGSDALGTARAIVSEALDPALAAAGLPEGAACLLESPAHAGGWAMFADTRLSLAVARGSGAAVAQLGAIARQSGVPVSLHGTGGAWMIADAAADPERFYAAAYHSLDRKVCNTLNVCCIVRERADELVPVFLNALSQAGRRRGQDVKLHVVDGSASWVPDDWKAARSRVVRAQGVVEEPRVEVSAESILGHEWEWEESPEVTLVVVDDLDQSVSLFNRYSPQFVACLISNDSAAQEQFYQTVNAPFVGDGFTRWVDGQYALNKPELGLSNWENGRLFARGGVLSGDGVFTMRIRVRQTDPHLDRAGAPTPAP